MNIHYYLGWFNHGISDKLVKLLNEDITDRKSLVMISGNTTHNHEEIIGATERSWLEKGNIKFDEYNLIDFDIDKEAAQHLVSNASVVFLLGGNPSEQNKLLVEYELFEEIKLSRAIVIGTSAGSMNMSAQWMLSDCTEDKGKIHKIFGGIGLDNFSILSHYDLENNIDQIQNDWSPLLKEMNLYASNKDCAIRVEGEKIDIFGDVYLISESKVQKLDTTL